MRLGRDQGLVISQNLPCHSARQFAELLNGAVYISDQSDVWVALEIAGPQACKVLERVCPIDLHPDVFSVDMLARTVMEHLGVIIARTNTNKYLLLSARSSARSFLHMLEISISNVK
jgi:sarcosine oxidase subunit gamma